MKIKLKRIVFISFMLLLTVTNALAMTPTWPNNARFTRGVRNTTYYIAPSARPYAANVRTAARNWVYTGITNPIEMQEVSSTYATHMDVYAKTKRQDKNLDQFTAAYVSFWDSKGNAIAINGNAPRHNYFYTEIIINKEHFPAAYRTPIMIHEMGHCFGLSHSNSPYSIMYPHYNSTRVSKVQKVDNDTILYLY